MPPLQKSRSDVIYCVADGTLTDGLNPVFYRYDVPNGTLSRRDNISVERQMFPPKSPVRDVIYCVPDGTLTDGLNPVFYRYDVPIGTAYPIQNGTAHPVQNGTTHPLQNGPYVLVNLTCQRERVYRSAKSHQPKYKRSNSRKNREMAHLGLGHLTFDLFISIPLRESDRFH